VTAGLMAVTRAPQDGASTGAHGTLMSAGTRAERHRGGPRPRKLCREIGGPSYPI